MTAGTRRTTNRTTSQPATLHKRARLATAQPHEDPMPRSTTRVVWTISQGAVVEYGDIS